MQILTIVNHTLALAIEIAVLVGVWKFATYNVDGDYVGAVAGVVLVGIMIALWARFAAPTSTTRLDVPMLAYFKAAVFTAACLTFWGAGLPFWAGVLALGSVVHLGLALWLGIL